MAVEKYYHIKRALYMGNFRIFIEFENGENKILDCNILLKGNMGDFEELRNEEKFKQFYIDTGLLTWPNGFDLAPEYTYKESKQVVLKEGKGKIDILRVN
ncbi:MAG: DUF2442 domain-containing protein [Ignavibacteriaceae bacterium]